MTEKLHVDNGLKNDRKSIQPSNQDNGPVSTSTSQKKRYLTISGIASETSYQEDQWPEFAVKELADNADDFFKESYPDANVNEKRIAVNTSIDTITVGEQTIGLLHITVRNSNANNKTVFSNLDGIFDYERWVSTKRNQHRITAGGLGDFLKRALGMGYASWSNIVIKYLPDSFEDPQWNYPVVLRFNGKEYKMYLVAKKDDTPQTRKEGPFDVNAELGTDTEVKITLPLPPNDIEDYFDNLLHKLERYINIFKLVKRNTSITFTKGGNLA